MRRASRVALLLLLAAALPAQANLELGKMWTFERPPLAYLEQEYGFKPDAAWLDALRLASLRFGEVCSASFVSPRGLIMTNHHCVRDNVAGASPPGQDWVADGFYAKAETDEKKLDGLTVQQLVSIRDVTEAMNAGVAAGDDEKTAVRKREQNQAEILKAAAGKDDEDSEDLGTQRQVVSLFQGAIFQLYTYRVYRDVRLVCAPHLQIAYFGGDPDNFTYPRYCADFAFCRAYVKGKPADTAKHYFKWSQGGAKEGELVFVTGNPGSTDRLLTRAQIEYHRDAELPQTLMHIDGQLAQLRQMMATDKEATKQLLPHVLNLENAQKAMRGEYGGLLDASLLEQKRQAEAAFRERIAADPAAKERFGGLWDRLESVARERTRLAQHAPYQTPGPSPQLAIATLLVRATSPDTPAEQQRVARRQLRSIQFPKAGQDVMQRMLVEHLTEVRDHLPADDPFRKAVLGELTPEQAAERIATSKLADAEVWQQLLKDGVEAVGKSDDPALVVARALLPLIDRNNQVRDELHAKWEELGVQMGRALFAAYGRDVSPDATFTLRFSDGVVQGYRMNGTLAPWRTTFHGLYARNLEFDGKHPFDLPAPWLMQKAAVDLTRPLNFVSTNDITGGNSGSPVVNQKLEVVGLIFDGNIESLPNRFLYRQDAARSVSVHVDGILEALRKVYGAERLAGELVANPPVPNR
jgi:hypothetical protein